MGYFSDKQIEEEESKTFGQITFAELQSYFPEYSHEQIKIAYLFMHFNPVRHREVMNGIFKDFKANLLLACEEAFYGNAINKLYTVQH